MPFSKLGLSSPILTALAEQGYKAPTDIQSKAIPAILAGHDVIAAAQTGTGKTASFVLPLLETLSGASTERAKRIRALILVPTRELALQVEASIGSYGNYSGLSALVMVGGLDSEAQKQRLIEGVDILVATPGRLLDMLYQKAVRFDELKLLVLDEADRMLDMGFIEVINKIIKRLPEERQTLLFSATLSKEVRALARRSLLNPLEISATKSESVTPQIEQWLTTVYKGTKSELLSHLIKTYKWKQALIFIRTKHGAAKLVSQLAKRGIKADAIHGDRSQAERTRVLSEFKSGTITYLVATDIAARGIDIAELPQVVNYDLPREPNDYIHRIGRTGRAGARGEAISLVSYDDFKSLCAIESRLDHLVARKEFEGFAPNKVVPVSILNYVPKNKRASSKAHDMKSKSEQNKKNPMTKKQRKSSSKAAHGNAPKSPWANTRTRGK